MTPDEIEEGRQLMLEDLQEVIDNIKEIMFAEVVDATTATAMFLECKGYFVSKE